MSVAKENTDVVARPWFREPWPWIIIGLIGSVMIASLVTLWIAATNPDALVVDETEYREIRSGLRAQADDGRGGDHAAPDASGDSTAADAQSDDQPDDEG